MLTARSWPAYNFSWCVSTAIVVFDLTRYVVVIWHHAVYNVLLYGLLLSVQFESIVDLNGIFIVKI